MHGRIAASKMSYRGSSRLLLDGLMSRRGLGKKGEEEKEGESEREERGTTRAKRIIVRLYITAPVPGACNPFRAPRSRPAEPR
jgi:hypothetical protein